MADEMDRRAGKNRFWKAMNQGKGSKELGTSAPPSAQMPANAGSTVAAPAAGPDSSEILGKLNQGVPVLFPPHLYIPKDAQSLDLKNLFDVAPGATITVLDFVCPKGAITVIQYYAIFNDGLLAANFDFYPTVDGRRVYQFHGDPLDNFRIYLGVGPDLGNEALIVGTLYLQPGQRLQWQAQNRSVVVTTMGVRTVGYVDYGLLRSQTRFGG